MTDDETRSQASEDGIAPVREAVGEELMRAARVHESAPWFRRRRWLALAACMVMVAVPSGIAAAQLLPDESESLGQPAPPPLFTTDAFESCPESVQEQILSLGSLSKYPETTGYPVEGCPTIEDLEAADLDIRKPALSSPSSPGEAPSGFDGDEATIRIDGATVTVNGETITCPADAAIRKELGFDPCSVLAEPARHP